MSIHMRGHRAGMTWDSMLRLGTCRESNPMGSLDVLYPCRVPGVPTAVTHTIRNKTDLLARVRRIRGQVEALERALEAEKGCTEGLQQIAAILGATSALMAWVIEDQ